MTQKLTVERRFHVRKEQCGRKRVSNGNGRETPSSGVPRVSRLMALAIHFDQLIYDGVVADQAELARLGRVTRARLSQIMNLLNLAPDIQEEVLHMAPLPIGRDAISERHLRPIAAQSSWGRQRRMWIRLMTKN